MVGAFYHPDWFACITEPIFDLLPPHRNQLLRIQHHLEPVGPFVWVVDGPLKHVALDSPGPAGVLAGGDPYPVASAPHPRLHALEGIGRSCCWGRGACQPYLLLRMIPPMRTTAPAITTSIGIGILFVFDGHPWRLSSPLEANDWVPVRSDSHIG